MKLKTLFITAAFALTGVTSIAAAQPTYAVTCPPGSVNTDADTLAACNLESTDNDLMSTVNIIINVVIGVIGLVAVMVIILGGFNYVTSNGEAAKTKKAKDTILYGVIGLIVSLLAFAIVNFVLTNVFTDPQTSGGGTGNPPAANGGTGNPPATNP